MKVVWFCEDDFDAADVNINSEDDFEVFERGFDAAAKAYGGGKWRLYLLPRDEQKMIDAEHVSEVLRALEVSR